MSETDLRHRYSELNLEARTCSLQGRTMVRGHLPSGAVVYSFHASIQASIAWEEQRRGRCWAAVVLGESWLVSASASVDESPLSAVLEP